jgi:hypothetical protein
MATGRQVLTKLVEADDLLTAEYSGASPARRAEIDYCARAIEGIIKEIVRRDLHTRTRALGVLSQELDGAAEELRVLKSTINSIVQAGQMAQQTLNALAALLPIL